VSEQSTDETLARSYCEAMGLEPDKVGSIPCPDGHAGCCVAHYGPQWQAVLPRAKRLQAEVEWARRVSGR